MIKFFKRLLFSILALIILVTIAGIVILETRRDLITQKLIEEINEQLLTRVEVDEIKLTIFHHFLHVTANFNTVVVFNPDSFSAKNMRNIEGADTLLFANRLYLDIDLSDLLRKEININRLEINEGKVFILVAPDKSSNYRVFKSSGDNNTGNNFHIKLKNIELHNLAFLVNNEYSGTFIKGNAYKTKICRKSSDMELQSNFLVHHFKHKNKVLADNKEAHVQLTFSREEKIYAISSGNLIFMDIELGFTGSYTNSVDPVVDFRIEAVNKKEGSLLEITGRDLQDKYELKTSPLGLKVGGDIKGEISRGKIPHINLDFTLQNGTLYLKNSNSYLEKLSVSGNYNNGLNNNLSSTKVLINNFSTQFKGSDIGGDFLLSNLKKPQFEFSLIGDLDLSEIHTLIPSLSEYSLHGMAHSNISISGDLNDLKNIELGDLENFKPAGHIELNNAGVEVKLSSLSFTEIYGSIMLGEHLWMDDIKGSLNGSTITLSGEVRNILSYLNNKKRDLVVQGELYSSELNLTNIIRKGESAELKESSRNFHFPKHLIAKIKLHADFLNLGKFNSENFRGTLFYEPSKLYINSLSFESMQGTVEGDCQLFSTTGTSLTIQAQTNLSNIDIHDLFASMNNFGQNFITVDNLKGAISGEIYFYSIWSKDLKIVRESIVAESDFIIKNGELNQFQPLNSLSRFIAVEELENIKFSELRNTIYISDEKVIIPKMDIHSSAFNITAAGTHNFSNNFNYRLKVLLSEVLAAKAKKTKKENETFGIIEDDGLGKTSLYFKVSGTPDNISVAYDRKEMMNSVKESIQKEKEALKTIFNEEFGRSKTDTSGGSGTREVERFQIIWDEEEQTEPDTTKHKKKKLNISWEEESDSTTIKYY